MTQTDINSTLDEWVSTTERILIAITEKNFKNFRRAYSDGCRHFRVISNFIQNNEIAEDIKNRILSVSDKWSATAAPLNLWKEEIGLELQSVRQGKKVRNKLSKAYAFKPSKAGANVRRKAK